MIGLGTLTFVTPWALAALVLLPAIWWLLRLTPPAPRRVAFPAVRLLLGLRGREEEPARTPPWLLAFRLLIAALFILAFADPLFGPRLAAFGRGPLLVVIDNGWAAATHWGARQRALDQLFQRRAAVGGRIVLLQTAPPASGAAAAPSGLLDAPAARSLAEALRPLPWNTDRMAALAALRQADPGSFAAVVWLSDGIDPDGRAKAFAAGLENFGPLRILGDPPAARALALLPPESTGRGLVATLLRSDGSGPLRREALALDANGAVLARVPVTFAPGATQAQAMIALPLTLANRIEQLAIAGEASAGARVLLDESFRRRPVGLVSGEDATRDQPLLSGLYYLKRALEPYAGVREGSLQAMLKEPPSVLVLDDVGRMTGPEQTALLNWLEGGGVLIRFAGPRLAAHDEPALPGSPASASDGTPDGGSIGAGLLPVPLRPGDRSLGGVLTWERPAHLAPFARTSPFYGLKVPADVTVTRQVLAEPGLDLARHTWARLTDGTPLVTAARRGKGWLVLFHTTANARWSNLALSGLYVEMLHRLVDLGHGVAPDRAARAMLAPERLLDGFGHFVAPGGAAEPLAEAAISKTLIGPHHPPGFYGPSAARRALNLTAHLTHLAAIGPLPGRVAEAQMGAARTIDLRPPLLYLALALLGLDFLLALWLRGLLGRRRSGPDLGRAGLGLGLGLGLLAASALLTASGPARAADASSGDAFAIANSTQFRLAYVLTGDAEVDRISRAGLIGLTAALNERTAAETGPPQALEIARDPLVFFPLIYWPMTPDEPDLDAATLAKIDTYITHGGTILFDTRDAGDLNAPGTVGPGTRTLRRLLGRLDTPPLIPLPANHVLTRTFYLLRDFPGRFDGSRIWVERETKGYDGVSGVIIGGNDWAGAWAVNANGQPLLPVVPGGAHQRELAIRFGINLVMYCLTGNYKSDQVHVPAILERLGQ